MFIRQCLYLNGFDLSRLRNCEGLCSMALLVVLMLFGLCLFTVEQVENIASVTQTKEN